MIVNQLTLRREREKSTDPADHATAVPSQEHELRPREKLLHQGAASLADAELLALLLGTGLPGRGAVATAKSLLATAGGLRGLLEMPVSEALRLTGLGPARYAGLQAALELSRRYFHARLVRPEAFNGPRGAMEFLIARFKREPREVFACLFLDVRHQLITFEVLFQGTLDCTTVHPREVARRSLELGAAAVLLAHNHPSGVAEPSEADRQLTTRLKQALGLLDVRVLDHIVTGDGTAVSFAERGWI